MDLGHCVHGKANLHKSVCGDTDEASLFLCKILFTEPTSIINIKRKIKNISQSINIYS